MFRKILLSCGFLSSLLYIAMNVFIPPLFEGYDSASQTVSELSAIDAPTRPLWVALAMVYIMLFACFGWGVWKSAAGNNYLRYVSIIIGLYVVVNFYWPPMHLRGNEPTLTDTLHIVWAMITIVMMMFIMIFGAVALGKTFRIITGITFFIFVLFGVLIGLESPGIARNLPTPYIGIWERINIGAFMIWMMIFARELLLGKNIITGRGS